MDTSEPAPRRSKREHQPSAKAAASLSSVAVSSSARRSQRRRVNRSASPASTPASTRNSSPVRGPTASPASSDLVTLVVNAVGSNGQRRRLRAAAHTGANSSVTLQGVHGDGKVLGKYSSRECALLCEVILSQLKKQTFVPSVLEEEKSPAFIRWVPVAKKMEITHKVRVTPRECQVLWKFLAYGQVSDAMQTDELLPDSDEEDFHKTPKEINAQLVKAKEVTHEGTEQGTTEGRSGDAEQETRDAPETQVEDETSVRLYPTYSLPTGAPNAWYRPFGPKDALPLTFVASRFLRRKVNPPPMANMYATSTAMARPNAAGATAAAALKRKQALQAASAEANKKPKVAVMTPPRAFTPSSTPPPAAKRARSELEFFEDRLRGELAKKTPGSKFELSAADIQRRFEVASVEVRRQCQALAAHDVERFNREVVRVRIWQKAMGSNSIKTQPTPADPASKPMPPACQAISTQPHSTNSAATAVAGSTKVPAPPITKSSGPTAALLAHAAAVAAAAANTKSSASTNATSISPKAVQSDKNGEPPSSSSAKPDAK